MKPLGITTYTKVMGITTWTKMNGVAGAVFNWATVYTYTTNASATLVTNWIGANISTSPNIPNVINGKPVIVNSLVTFKSKTALTNCTIESNVSFVDNSMTNAFRSCSNLIGVNAIPNSVTNMASAFYYCAKLVNAPTIPNSVTDMFTAFQACTALVNAPTIPNGVTKMAYAFYSCDALVYAPTIGNSVTNMAYAFSLCTALVGNITVVNANVTNFASCFYGCNASKAKTLRCPTGSASYNLAIDVCNAKNGVTVVGY